MSQPCTAAVIGALVLKENQTQQSPKIPSGGDAATAQVLVRAEASQSAALSRQSVFEKLTLESEDQRPAAKRQLSSESAARTITVVKKSAVRNEAEEQAHLKPKPQMGQRLSLCAAALGRRRRRKDLFANTEVFHRVDTHVIRTGAEVTTLSHDILLSSRTTTVSLDRQTVPLHVMSHTALPQLEHNQHELRTTHASLCSSALKSGNIH